MKTLILGVLLFLILMVPVQAATFEVTNTSDAANGLCEVANTGDGCTLREAITAANAAAGSDVITFRRGVIGTILLASSLPPLTSDMIINGPGANRLTVEPHTQRGRIPSEFSLWGKSIRHHLLCGYSV